MVDVLYPDLSGNGKGVVDLNTNFYPSPGYMLRPKLGQTVTIPTIIYGVGPYQWIDLSDGGNVVFQDGQEGYPEWFGVFGVDDHIPLGHAMRLLTVTRTVPGKVYVGGGINKQMNEAPAFGKIYDFRGSLFRDIIINNYSYSGDHGAEHGLRTASTTLLGGTFQRVLADLNSPPGPVQIHCSDFTVDGSEVQEYSGTQGYNDGFRLHQFTKRCKILNTVARAFTSEVGAPDGYVIQGREHKLDNISYEGHDDCITIKSATNPGDGEAGTRDIQASNVSSYYGANVWSVGSEIGFGVKCITGTNLNGRETGSIVSYEIGRLAGYAGGYLIDATAVGGSITSKRLVEGIISYSARGGCYGKNIHSFNFTGTVRARDNNSAISMIRVYVNRESQEGTLLDPTYIDDWSINDINAVDANDGASYTADTNYPIDHFINIEEVNGAYQKDGRITKSRFRGCANSGILINAPSNNRILLDDIRVERWGTEVGSSALQLVAGTVEIHKFVAKPETSMTIFNLGAGSTVIAEYDNFRIPELAAAASGNFQWDCPVDCLILEIFVVPTAAVTQGASDKSDFTFTNLDTGGQIYKGSPDLSANTRNKLGAGYFTHTHGSPAYMTKGKQLNLNISPIGAGRATPGETQIIIHYLPYGER